MVDKVKVEKEAVRIAMEYEKSQGRKPKDVTGDKNHLGYDIISGNLKIEVKGRSGKRRPFFILNYKNIECLEQTKDENYRLYVVMSPESNPKIIIFTKDEILKRKKEYMTWEIPLRKEDYAKEISV